MEHVEDNIGPISILLLLLGPYYVEKQADPVVFITMTWRFKVPYILGYAYSNTKLGQCDLCR